MNKPITITILGERAMSWNAFWSQGTHWSKRARYQKETQLLVRCNLPEECEMYTVPVDLTVIATFKKNPIDCSNLAIKPFEDALKGWLLRDDDPRYVRSVTTISRKADNDSVTLLLQPVYESED